MPGKWRKVVQARREAQEQNQVKQRRLARSKRMRRNARGAMKAPSDVGGIMQLRKI